MLLRALATDAFYQRQGDTVAGFHAYPPALPSACPGIGDSVARQALIQTEGALRTRLPQERGAL